MHKYKGGRKRQEFNDKFHNLAVFKNELTDVKTMSFKLKHFEKEKLELEKKCKDIFQLLINEKGQNLEIIDENKSLKTRK